MALNHQPKQTQKRIILYTGKGGVGKTSIAAATALRSAEMGHRTIVLSTDAAHSLADSFDITLGGKPRRIAPNLWGQETDMVQTVESYWGTIQEWVSALLAWRGMEEIMADEMAILPGMEELASLLYIVNYYDSGDYDVIIVDCAPTGETLRLLSFPEILSWWWERLFPLERKAAAVLRPIIKPILNVPYPDDEVFDSAQKLYHDLEKMSKILKDPQKTSIRLVLNPEKMVVKEAQRTFTYLNLFGYHTDLIICNRLIPKEVNDRYFNSWKESQSQYHRLIEEAFAPLPIRDVPLFSQEVVGEVMLRLTGKALFGDDDPSLFFFHGQARGIKRRDGYYIMTIPLPFLEKEDISLSRNGDELIIHAGKQKRNIILPRSLLGLEIEGAKFEGDNLKIRFREKEKTMASKQRKSDRGKDRASAKPKTLGGD